MRRRRREAGTGGRAAGAAVAIAAATLMAGPAAAEMIWSDSAGGAWGVYAWEEPSGAMHCGMETAYYDEFDTETAAMILQLYAETGLWMRYCDWGWNIPQGEEGRGRLQVGRFSQVYPVSTASESCIDFEIGWDEGFFEAFRRSWTLTMTFPNGDSQEATLRGTNANAQLLADCADAFLGNDGRGGTKPSTSPFDDGGGGSSSPF
ncbi:MAG: hypothetical protein GVY28_06790 [Alphaproteobacteria bacterium]|jgi:hypothetical protein|nr:hypothetical protein [Alphaproteobacteria bacterium]